MRSSHVKHSVIAALACGAGACGGGNAPRVDATSAVADAARADAATIDAHHGDAMVDAPQIDAHVDATVDAAVDAPQIDAQVATTVDAHVDATVLAHVDATVDAHVDAGPPDASPPCGTLGFSAPVLIGAVNNDGAFQHSAIMSPDQLELIFLRQHLNGRSDILHSTRASTNDDWSSPSLIFDSIATPPMSLAANSTKLYTFFNSVSGKTTRASQSASFVSPSGVSDPSNNLGFFISADDSHMYMVHTMGGSSPSSYGLSVGDWNGSSASSIVAIPGFEDSDGFISAPVVNSAETWLFFESDNFGGDGGEGGGDIWASSRASTSDAWIAPFRVDGVNTDGSDNVTWASDNGCEILITSLGMPPGHSFGAYIYDVRRGNGL